ncbi:hypothetical protein FZC78_03705 [Rossellomorea vietnamensis]|uniref:Uncharacterized protein n=1 Tax=Rossellomorea vietnamensis TaxID=218284 RepID=A0A5D4NYM6_9BACI|nr:hypothetical protein [Rossellomorea vietnamensis]TYS18638.1 hypothetical protein FZC78_03705 [Rossellomorea vietnamensis]
MSSLKKTKHVSRIGTKSSKKEDDFVKKWQAALMMLIIFIGGYLAGIYFSKEEVTREIRVGYQDRGRDDVIHFKNIIKNTENQSAVDNIMMIFMKKEKIADPDVNLEKPDIYLEVLNPKHFTGLIDSRIWFKDEGAVIAERSGESWEDVVYYSIHEQDADYLKQIAG